MKLSASAQDLTSIQGGLVAVGRFAEGEPSAAEQALDTALNGALSALGDRMKFAGKPGQVLALDPLGQLPADRVMVIGLGEEKALDAEGMRRFAATAHKGAIDARLSAVSVANPFADEQVHFLAEGAVMASYRFDTLKTQDPDDPPPSVETFEIIAAEGADLSDHLARGEIMGNAVNLARQLCNEPAHVCTPERLAEVAREMGQHPHAQVTIYGPSEIAEHKMGGLMAVASGAEREARFIHLAWNPPGSNPEDAVAFVGKGITFDSGGLSLKPTKSMMEMHMDMGGSAAVLGAARALVDLEVSTPFHAIVAACENMPGGDAFRPTDVLTISNGKTVEIHNTDAEGRLVLSDALHYAEKLKPRGIVDLATLTGACMVGLGPNYAGLFSDHDDFRAEVEAAAKAAGERVWRLPLDPGLKDSLKTPRADVKNLGGPWGGAITAALYLSHFVEDTPWVHLDIAGPAMADKSDALVKVGGTGFGVLTLTALLTGER